MKSAIIYFNQVSYSIIRIVTGFKYLSFNQQIEKDGLYSLNVL